MINEHNNSLVSLKYTFIPFFDWEHVGYKKKKTVWLNFLNIQLTSVCSFNTLFPVSNKSIIHGSLQKPIVLALNRFRMLQFSTITEQYNILHLPQMIIICSYVPWPKYAMSTSTREFIFIMILKNFHDKFNEHSNIEKYMMIGSCMSHP